MNLILPRGSSYSGNYNDMDISLLYTLLRNICSIPPHSNGWGNDPHPTDRSLSANIERIRIARNQCVHFSSPVLSNADFNSVWSTVRSAVVDLDSFLNNGNQYEREVDFLRHETMDPVRDRHLLEELRKQAEEDAATREIVQGLRRKVEEMDTDRTENRNRIMKIDGDVSRLRNAAIPPNVKAIHDSDVREWKEDDKNFLESHNFSTMLEKVKNKPHVTFVGVPGSGKTSTARHIALMLQQDGYEIVPIKDIRKIEDYCDPNNPQVFVIDDVVGVFGLQNTKLNLLTDYKDRIMKPVMSKSKTLLTCREAVYRESLGSSSFFTDENNTVLLHNEVYALTNADKKCLLKKYNIDVDLLSPENLISASKMFPYLCKLFSNEKKFQFYGPVFFENPVPCILEELDEMKKQNKIQYACLVLCMMNENKISGKILKTDSETVIENFLEMKLSVLELCKVSSHTDNFKFVDALSEMEGTYTKLYGTKYNFIHDSMFEIVAHHFGSKFPELILKFMSSNYIANNVKVQESLIQKLDNENKLNSENAVITGESEHGENNENSVAANKEKNAGVESFDLCIRLEEKYYLMLAERLYRDIENMELYDVFMNNVLKEPKVYQAFEEVLKTKSDTEFNSLFLAEQKDVTKIVRKSERVREEYADRNWNRDRQRELVNTRWEGSGPITYSVRVISWVIYYGHNRILQYILNRTENKETKQALFKNIEDNKITEECRLILLSCYSGYLETVKILMKYIKKDTLNTIEHCPFDSDARKYTPLTAACQGGHISIVKELIMAGADVNLRGGYSAPLIEACRYGHLDVVKELIEAGTDVNVKICGDTPLTAACKYGHIDVVKELIETGADVNIKDYNTPLTAACGGGHESVVKELIKAKADVNLQGESDTPLSWACRKGNVIIVKDLIKAGADVDQQGLVDTPLIAACKSGQRSVVKELLKAKADVNLSYGFDPPLSEACIKGNVSIVKDLLKAGANVNPPLITACECGHISVVQQLIESGADVNLKDECGIPLTKACKGGHMSVVKKLLEAGADVNIQDSSGRTPLHEILLYNTETQIPVILMVNTYGADPTICDEEGFSAFCIALIQNKIEVVNQLLEAENGPQLNRLKLHLFHCLVNIRHSGVMLDSKDDVVVNKGGMFHVKESGFMFQSIIESKCDLLKHLLDLGLNVNQWIQLYDDINSYFDVKPLLFTLIDEGLETYRDNVVEKVRILLEAGADVNVRVTYRGYLPVSERWLLNNDMFELYDSDDDDDDDNSDMRPDSDDNDEDYDSDDNDEDYDSDDNDEDYDSDDEDFDMRSVLDQEGLSVLERTQRLLSKFRRKNMSVFDKDKIPVCKEVLIELKKHVRRYSV